MLLVDAGAEFENYAADITRTYPINGRFTVPQSKIYTLVLSAQKAGIACIKPGVPFALIQQTILGVLTAGLSGGFLEGKVDALISSQAYKPFYMHNSGHWLGLDVHDCGHYYTPNKSSRLLEAGMVLTVEPGLYISADHCAVPHDFHNIGIRIEDDILVTEQGHDNLSGALPVDMDDIEACLRG